MGDHGPGRAVWLAGVVAALLAVPAIAQAQQGQPERCNSADTTCVGRDKLAERASAECRRAGDAVPTRPVSDPTCQPPVGRQVDRAAVAAYQDSWTHRALRFQYELGHDLGFVDAPWIGTHNSYNSTSEFPTLSHTDSNQQLSLFHQLELDVRSLEIDVHWAPTPRSGTDGVQTAGRAPVVCHATTQQGVHVGCTSERLLSEFLGEVAGWLNRPENRDQVLLLYLEDHLDGNYAAAGRVLDSVLTRPGEGPGSMIHRAGATDEHCRSLPLTLTRREVLDAGAQVVIVGDCGNGWNSRVFAWGSSVRVEARPRAFSPRPDCGGIARGVYDTRLVRFYEDTTFVTSAASRAGQARTDDGLMPATTAAMARCGVDLFGFDQLLPDDGRLDAAVWSWARDKPVADDGGCAFQGADERWATGRCAQARPAACRQPGGGWTVTPGAVAYDEADSACRALGAQFDLPRTGHDNATLREAGGAGAGEVWLRHRPFEERGGPRRRGRPDAPPPAPR